MRNFIGSLNPQVTSKFSVGIMMCNKFGLKFTKDST